MLAAAGAESTLSIMSTLYGIATKLYRGVNPTNDPQWRRNEFESGWAPQLFWLYVYN